MLESNWDAGTIYTILDAPRVHDFRSDITVLKIDDSLKVVIGNSQDGSVFFGCPQFGEIKGFKKDNRTIKHSQVRLNRKKEDLKNGKKGADESVETTIPSKFMKFEDYLSMKQKNI